MILPTPDLQKRLLANCRQRGVSHIPVAKFFNPLGASTWLATEFDDDNTTCLAWLTGQGRRHQGHQDPRSDNARTLRRLARRTF
jgi:hypothetical protein